jgi:hypothetical protein
VAARPAAGYKKLYGHLTEQADIAFEVGLPRGGRMQP